ncbi:MAG: glycosyltransferase family 1 protein [Candidatus Cloacimonadota bacterium]|nr:MAG: glycosyltransferase family 1 protein [Candidatus Cloacimonadota bacterium]
MNRKKLKIGFVSDAYYPHVGGIQEHIYHLGIEFKKMGHQVKVITGSAGDNSAPPGLDVIRIGRVIQIPANKSFMKSTVGLGIGARLRGVFKIEKFDIVHVHGPPVPFLHLYSHSLSSSSSTNIHTFHASFNRSTPCLIFKKSLQRYIEKIDGIIAVSKIARDSITKYLSANFTIIPNGVDITRFNPEKKRLKKFSGMFPLLLFVGRFELRKGLKFLFFSFNHIVKKFPDAGLIVVGEGRMKEYYKAFLSKSASKKVFFEGKVSMEMLPSYFATCDIFCSPAYTGESFGIILLEALASGKPVIASNIPGYRNVIKDGYNGILVPPKAPDAITNAVLRITEDKGFEKRLIYNGLKSAKQYSWENVSKMIEDFYYKTMGKKE